MVLSQQLIDKLACPKCHGGLTYDQSEQTLSCENCGLRYRIKDDIPVLLVDEAISLDQIDY